MSNNTDFSTQAERLIRCGQPFVIVPTQDILECQLALAALAYRLSRNKPTGEIYLPLRWDPLTGFRCLTMTDSFDQVYRTQVVQSIPKEFQSPALADPLNFVQALHGGHSSTIPAEKLPRAIVTATDFHPFLISQGPAGIPLRAAFKELIREKGNCSLGYKRPLWLLVPPHVIAAHSAGDGLIGPAGGTLPPEILDLAAVLEFPLPGEAEIGNIVDFLLTCAARKPKCEPEVRRKICGTALGLRRQAVEDAVSLALVDRDVVDDQVVDIVEEQKAARISQGGFLIYKPMNTLTQPTGLAGFAAGLQFMRQLGQPYKEVNKGKKLDKSRGILLLGIPGTGKTEFAKMASHVLGEETGIRFTTYFLNVGAMFGPYVGQTEARFSQVINTLRTQGYYVLVIDEMEKLLGLGDSASDGGVASRANAQVLTWLEERENDPNDNGIVIGTMNTTRGLAPEMFSRFNGTFATDLPTGSVRQGILEIHLNRRGVRPADLVGLDGKPVTGDEWGLLVRRTEAFIGREIKNAVVQAKNIALMERGADAPAFEELLRAVDEQASSIIAVTKQADVAASLEYTRAHARPVYTGGDALVPIPQPRHPGGALHGPTTRATRSIS